MGFRRCFQAWIEPLKKWLEIPGFPRATALEFQAQRAYFTMSKTPDHYSYFEG